MPEFTVIVADGSERTLPAPEDIRVMAAATGAGLPVSHAASRRS